MLKGKRKSSTKDAGKARQLAGRIRRWAPLAPLASLIVLGIVLLEGPRLLKVSGLAAWLPEWPIEAVMVTGDLRQLSRVELQASIGHGLDADFFGLDVGAIRDIALALPWVEEASVRKVWPGKLHVHVRERQVVARWAEGGLVATDGTLFYPRGGRGLDTLPVLAGPAGSQAQILSRYRALSGLLAPLEQRLERVGLDSRGGWLVRLADGPEFVLGPHFDDESLGKLATRLPRYLGERLARVARIDLRYANGFAVRWKDGEAGLAMGSTQ